jgi:hypothetical protein
VPPPGFVVLAIRRPFRARAALPSYGTELCIPQRAFRASPRLPPAATGRLALVRSETWPAARIARRMFLRLKRSGQCTSRGCVQLQSSRVVSSRPGLARNARRMPRTTRPGGVMTESQSYSPVSAACGVLRGSSPSGYPAEPLVSYQINRQLSGWNLPPLMIRAFGAHCQNRTFELYSITSSALPRRRRDRRKLRSGRSPNY